MNTYKQAPVLVATPDQHEVVYRLNEAVAKANAAIRTVGQLVRAARDTGYEVTFDQGTTLYAGTGAELSMPSLSVSVAIPVREHD